MDDIDKDNKRKLKRWTELKKDKMYSQTYLMGMNGWIDRELNGGMDDRIERHIVVLWMDEQMRGDRRMDEEKEKERL